MGTLLAVKCSNAISYIRYKKDIPFTSFFKEGDNYQFQKIVDNYFSKNGIGVKRQISQIIVGSYFCFWK
ncbi:hypothetical protein [Flavobacterium frigidarium]|uniref:hypothetical protein n=1 Tax=Flavobacterium frigidarium TaxID=99286 RepID=UPI0030D84012